MRIARKDAQGMARLLQEGIGGQNLPGRPPEVQSRQDAGDAHVRSVSCSAHCIHSPIISSKLRR